MTDSDLQYDSDEYHEDDFSVDLHRDDSLPDLVLSSSLSRDQDLDLTSHLFDPPADLETEYFNTDQVTTSVRLKDGGIRVSYTDTEKPYVTQRITSCADKYRSYLNLTVPSDEESGDECLQEEFKRLTIKKMEVRGSPFCCSFSLSPETQSMQRKTWAEELVELDREMVELEERLRQKVKLAGELKEKLGVTAWREFSQDFREGMKTLKDSPTYRKVEAELSCLAVEVGEEAGRVRMRASLELEKVSVKTSSSLASAQRKLTQKLQDIGVVEQPKIYRNNDIEPVIATASKLEED